MVYHSLQEQVDYNYAEYDSIGLMNLNIIMGKVKGADMDKPKFAGTSGAVPEAFAIAMMICGSTSQLTNMYHVLKRT